MQKYTVMDKMIPFYNTENIPGQKYELISTVKGSMMQEAAEILVYGTAVKFV
jgi:hypothetical protein